MTAKSKTEKTRNLALGKRSQQGREPKKAKGKPVEQPQRRPDER